MEGRPTILIADDDELMRTLLSSALIDGGFTTVEAVNGTEALAQFERVRPQLLLLDVDMPELSGFDVCAEVRRSPTGANVPIVMVTGNDDTQSVERAYQAGATDFINKPLNFALLCHRVRYILRNTNTHNALIEKEAENGILLQALPDRIALVMHDGTPVKMMAQGDVSQPTNGLVDLLPEKCHETLLALLRSVAANGLEQTFAYTDEAQGTAREFELRVAPRSTEQSVVIIRDVTEKRRDEARIQQLAYYDSLTELPNRHRFFQWSQDIIDKAQPDQDLFAMIHINIDRLKRINDSLGPEAGDRVLQQFGTRLRQLKKMLRQRTNIAEVARVGGDEFTLMLELTHKNDAVEVLTQINHALIAPIQVERHHITMTVSIGAAIYPEDGVDVQNLHQHAQSAAMSAKAVGGNAQLFYINEEQADAADLMTLESELRTAIEHDALTLFFQPKFRLNDGQLHGAEALIRWEHPTRGFVSPAEFIPLAERSGLIVDIDNWVVRRCCALMAEWQSRHTLDVPISINLSGREFCFDDPVTLLADSLAAHKLNPRLLEIEITEGVLVSDTAASQETLQRIKEMGVRIAIDDFGTGYSSLSYLKQFPLDVVKIDRAFVKDLEQGVSDQAMCRAIIAMTHALDLEVVAEGIETQFQAEFLREAGCHVGQGYYLAMPMAAASFAELLQKHASHLLASA